MAGFPVDMNSVLMGLTLAGVADVCGGIEAADYFLIDRGRALRRTGWYFGDFDYSGGAANGDDYVLIDRGFLDQQTGGALSISAPAQAVPEPGLMIPMTTALALLRRRRKVSGGSAALLG